MEGQEWHYANYKEEKRIFMEKLQAPEETIRASKSFLLELVIVGKLGSSCDLLYVLYNVGVLHRAPPVVVDEVLDLLQSRYCTCRQRKAIDKLIANACRLHVPFH
ncbi:hypothetical protein GQ600_18216 [Phytophthora cactorum]|nr:hypothetical protein GQ600_18212 [Phytophthora cactorum]KAF1786954.1 hypothetical protein GQ600_18216 [Phytophthora cactorum]